MAEREKKQARENNCYYTGNIVASADSRSVRLWRLHISQAIFSLALW